MEKTGRGYGFAIDVDAIADTPLGTPNWQEVCPTSVSKALNEAIDTYFQLCNEGFATNVVTGLDPQYDLTVKGDTDNAALNAILDTEFDIDKRNLNAIQITDNFTGNTITVSAPITAISDTREIETVIEFSFSFKFKGKPTIA